MNNDGDLPYDICEDDEMEKLLQDAMDEQGMISPENEEKSCDLIIVLGFPLLNMPKNRDPT